MCTADLSNDDVTWIKTYARKVDEAFRSRFVESQETFEDGLVLLDRFQDAISNVLNHGRGRFRAVDEAHNELCIALAILSSSGATMRTLEYEPVLDNQDKSIDFRAHTESGEVIYIDVKTIRPTAKDRWDQYEMALKEEWLPENVQFVLSQEWLGGELWHNAFAARSRMLEYSLDLEEKISVSHLDLQNACILLMLCGEGFYWREDELEDFVAYYKTGLHRSDDPFSEAESYYVQDEAISIAGTISRFGCMRRPQGEIFAKRINWNVLPPVDPGFLWPAPE